MADPEQDLEALDLLAERQRRTAENPDLGVIEVRAPWPVVPGWQPPPEPDPEENDDEDGGGFLAGPEADV